MAPSRPKCKAAGPVGRLGTVVGIEAPNGNEISRYDVINDERIG